MIKIFPIKLNDVNDIWINWLNDKIVTKYSIQRKKKHTLNLKFYFLKKN
jgi:hypothetical protein